MEVLRFTSDRLQAKPQRDELDPGDRGELTRARGKDAPAAYVVRNRDVDRVGRFDDVIDRGRKHKATQLSKLLLGHDGIPVIRGSYSDSRQLVHSIRSLLANAKEDRDHNVYVVGADDPLFENLWDAAEVVPAAGDPAPSGAPPLEVLDLLPPVDVPADLESEFVGTSRASRGVRQLIVRAATTPQDVLILGDTGTGKEVVARAIQKHSRREPFVQVSCGGLSGEQFERALFGDVVPNGRGTTVQPGYWQLAGKGMLFLDEIGGLRLDHQTRILRALEERRISPVGSRRDVAVPARVIAASNRDLYALMQEGQFLEDLYYRLRAFTIQIPPLRMRPEDIPELAQHFWAEITWEKRRRLSPEILTALQTYYWPGNARELRAVLCNLHALFGAEKLRVEHVRAVFHELGQAPMTGPLRDGDATLRRISCLRHLRHVDEVLQACLVTLRPLIDGARSSRATVTEAHAALHYRLHELDLLCMHPLLFCNEATFASVYGLKGKLTYFHGLLETSPKKAMQYWKREVAGQFGAVTNAVLREQKRVVGDV